MLAGGISLHLLVMLLFSVINSEAIYKLWLVYTAVKKKGKTYNGG